MSSETDDFSFHHPRVLVIKLSSLGDLFHALPAVHCLKVGLNATIDWLTQTQYVELAKCFTDVDRVVPFYRKTFLRNIVGFLRELRKVEYDLIIDFQGICKSAISGYLAHGKNRIGPSFHREGSILLYSDVAGRKNKNRHAVEENLDVVHFLQLPLLPAEFPMDFPIYPIDAPRPRVALIPFARWRSKNWPFLSFVKVAKEIHDRMNASIFLLGGREDTRRCTDVEKELTLVNLVGKISLVQLGGLLREMDLVITNDSGPMHMAAALGIPVLAIFGPTDPLRTGPYGSGNHVIKGKLKCQPCFSRVCRFGDNACLRSVTPDMVIKSAMSMLEEMGSALNGVLPKSRNTLF